MTKKSIKVNAILNIIKQMCQVVFPLITIPYVTRVLQTENYGKYNYGNSIVTYFWLLAELGVATYAVREGARIREEKKAFQKFASEMYSINIISTLFSYIALIIVLLVTPKLHDYRMLILIQSAVILFSTLGADWVNTIYEDFITMTIRSILVQVVALIGMFVFVHEENDYIKYAMVTVFATSGAGLFNTFYIRKYVKIKLTLKIDWKKHLKPIILLFFNVIMIQIYANSDITLIGIFKGDREVGLYSLAAKMYIIIKQVLNAVIVVVFPRLLAYMANDEKKKYQELLNRLFNGLIILIFPVVVALIMLSDKFVLLMSEENFLAAANSLQILSISLIFAAMCGIFSNCILLVFDEEVKFVKATIVGAVSNILLNLIIIPRFGAEGAAVTTIISEFAVCLITYLYSRKYQKCKLDFRNLVGVIIGCIFLVMECVIVNNVIDGVFIPIVICAIIGVIGYGIIMLISGSPIVKETVRQFLKK